MFILHIEPKQPSFGVSYEAQANVSERFLVMLTGPISECTHSSGDLHRPVGKDCLAGGRHRLLLMLGSPHIAGKLAQKLALPDHLWLI